MSQYQDWNSLPFCNGSFATVLDQVYGAECGYNTQDCTCDEIDFTMASRYCVESGCGTIPDALFQCNDLSRLDLSGKSLTGTISPQISSLTQLQHLNISNNDLIGSVPSSIGSLSNLRVMDMSSNHLSGTLPLSFRNLNHLEEVYLDRNMFNGSVEHHFETMTSLYVLYLSENEFVGAVPYLRDLDMLETVMLHRNRFSNVQTDSFSGLSSLRTLSLASQNVEEFTLERGSFRNLSSASGIFLADNKISTLPSLVFDGRQNTRIDLQNLGITTILPRAFDGTANVSILLNGNRVHTVSPIAFPQGAVRGSNCTDYAGWSGRCSEIAEIIDCDQTCSNVNPYIYVAKDNVHALDACCAFGGGHANSANLVMDAESSIRCGNFSLSPLNSYYL